MAIINRFQIRRYNEIQLDISPGTIPDGGFSTFNLDNPTSTGPFGTSDFVGVLKQLVLLGEIIKEVVDTNPRKLRQDPIPIARFNQLTQAEFTTLVQNGDIVINPMTRGNAEVIGWIELGKSYPSFYYQDCSVSGNAGKQPKSDNYYELSQLTPSLYRVNGQGNGPIALQQIGSWNINETYGNWGASAYPGQEPMSFEDYMRVVVNGGGTDLFTFLTQRPLLQIPLLIADRLENFDGNNTTILTPSFSDPTSATPTNEKTVYGRIRRTITEGFKGINLKTSLGICIPLSTTVTPPTSTGDGTTEEGEDELSDTYDYFGEEDFSEVLPDEYVDDIVVLTNDDILNIPCEKTYGLPIRVYSNGSFVATGSSYYFGVAGNTMSGSKQMIVYGESDVSPIQNMLEDSLLNDGVKDPRSMSGNSEFIPNGTFKSMFNKNDCVIEIHEDYRDKDGDIPEVVGPIVTRYIENVRKEMINRFITENPLKLIGYGTDGYEYYSDGNSYTELHGESIFGCGYPFSIADIPEIFNEMYPVSIKDKQGRLAFGHDENENVSFFRETFERPTQLPLEAIKVLDWLGGLPIRFVEKRGTLSDMFNDFVLGVPDLDFALVGDNESESMLNDIVGTALGAVAGATLASFFVSDSKDYLEQIDNYSTMILAGAVVGYSLAQTIKAEEDVYKKNWSPRSSKPKPKSIARYRSYNSFWKRDGLNKVYYETALNDVLKRAIISGKRTTGPKISPEGEVIDIETGSESSNETVTNRTTNQPDIIDVPVWEGKTPRQLRTSQFKLSYPSRWKSMMRPIYQDLWYDKDEIKPENVSTREYLGENILELELGDYESHRKIFGMNKNLYDYIDDAISLRVDDTTFADETNQIDLLSGIITNVSGQLRGFFDEKFANIVGFNLDQPTTTISNLINSINNLSDLKSYIVLLDSILQVYSSATQLAESAVESIRRLESIGNSIGKYVQEHENGFMGPPDESLIRELKGAGEQLLISISESVVDYIISSGLQWLTNELNRTNPPRSSFSPRRTFKRGGVYLRSKSGLYSTNKQPCPVIFLGFNDESVMSSFSEFNKQLDCLSTLTKEDKITNLKYLDKRGFLTNGRETIMSSIRPTIGDAMTNKGNIDRILNPVKQETIPVINKRIRQYGRNPLLDVFYLNLIPESFANNSNTAPYTHRTSTPMPYRFPNRNDWAGNREFTKDYSIPSHFPPHWNEPGITEGSAGKFYKDQSMFKHGDPSFFNRQSSNIITAKDRWLMSMDTISDENVIVLTDKTPILDIYFGLLQMHLYGFSWEEINHYIKRAKSAISIRTADIQFLQERVPSSINSSIDLNELERLWKIINARLNYSKSLYISEDGYWYKVEPISTNFGQGKIGEAFLAASINVGRNKNGELELANRYRRELFLMNNTNKTIKINSVRITNLENSIDMFGSSPSDMFYVGYNFTTNPSTETVFDANHQFNPIILQPFNPNPKEKNIIWLQPFPLWVWFIPYGAEPGFEYRANLELVCDIEGEEYVFNRTLIGSVENKPSVRNWSNELLSVSDAIHYGRIDDIIFYQKEPFSIGYQNYAREDIVIDKIEILNERILDINQNDITSQVTNSPNFFIFDGVEEEFHKTIFPNQKIVWSGKDTIEEIVDGTNIVVNKDSLTFTNTFQKDRIYVADVTITYSLNPRFNSESRVVNTKISQLRFSTIS